MRAARGGAALYETPWLLLTLTTLFWAGNAVASRLAVGEVGPVELVFLRWAIVAGMLWPVFGAQVRAHWGAIRPRLGLIVTISALGFTGFNTLFYFAAQTTTAVNIGILQGSMPVFVMIGAFVLYGSRVSLRQGIGVAITLCGVVLIATGGAPTALGSLSFVPGDLIMLLACVLYASYAVGLQRRPAVPGAAFFTLMSVVAMITALPLLLIDGLAGRLTWPTTDGWLITLYVAVFPSCLSQLFFLRGVDLIGPGRAGVYINLVPVFAALLAVAILEERFAGYHALALALVLGGIVLAQRKPRAGV